MELMIMSTSYQNKFYIKRHFPSWFHDTTFFKYCIPAMDLTYMWEYKLLIFTQTLRPKCNLWLYAWKKTCYFCLCTVSKFISPCSILFVSCSGKCKLWNNSSFQKQWIWLWKEEISSSKQWSCSIWILRNKGKTNIHFLCFCLLTN